MDYKMVIEIMSRQELIRELEYAQNRISDLMVERDTGKWRERLFGELQEKFDMKRECLDLDKFEEVKTKWKMN